MSGPKESDYELTERLRREEKERRLRIIEEEKCQILEGQLEVVNKVVQRFEEDFRLKVDKFDSLKASELCPENHPSIGLIETIIQQVDVVLQTVRGLAGPRNSASLQKRLQLVKDYEKQLRRNGLSLEEPLHELENFIKQARLQEKEALLDDVVVERIDRRTFSLEEKNNFGVEVQGSNAELVKVYQSIIIILEEYVESPFLTNRQEISELMKSIDGIFHDEEMDSLSKERSITLRAKSFLATKDKYDIEIERGQKISEEFQELQLTYLSLTSYLEVEPKEFHLSEDGLKEMALEIELLEDALYRKNKNQMVSEAIQQVMDELGYNVLATDEIVTPKREIDHIVLDYEKNNVINVFTSNNGSILFEVSAVKEAGNELTSLEKQRVKEGMDDFCTTFPIITDKLREKGVEVTLKRAFPADVRFARAIDVEKINQRKQARVKKRRSTPTLKRQKME